MNCFDCNQEITGGHQMKLRQSTNSPGCIRVPICNRCDKGVKPVKRSFLNKVKR